VAQPVREHICRTVAGLVAVMLVALVAGGCGGGLVTNIRNEEEFQERVIEAKRPVLMDFYKGGCPTCVAIEPTMEHLAEDFGDRVLFARFQIITPFFGITNEYMKKEYRVAYYPTVVLFIDGKEKKRFVLVLNEDQCRQTLEELVGPPKAKEPKP
jgi:thioredoxin 1